MPEGPGGQPCCFLPAMPGRGLLALVVCFALVLPGVRAGNRFTVNESSCTFVDAINGVNFGLALVQPTPIPPARIELT